MISTQARAMLDRMFADKQAERQEFPGGKPLALRRSDWEANTAQDVLPEGARFAPAEGAEIPSEWAEMPGAVPGRGVLWLHGGGYNAGTPRIYRKMAAHIARVTRAKVLVPDYRLAPEHVFPAAVIDALKAYDYLLSQGFSEDKVIIGGDSAGGGLTLSTLLALRDRGRKLPRLAILLSPWTDLSCSSPTYETARALDPIIDKEGLSEAGLWYVGERDPRQPLASPMFADLKGLPPMVVHAGGDETMLDDSRIFVERARAAGVEVTFKIYEGMWHVHHGGAPDVPESMLAYNDLAAFIRAQLGD